MSEPYYLPLADEVEVFEAAYHSRLPVLLKGPTGCGKTRFVEHMTWRLYENCMGPRAELDMPLVTVSCHEDLRPPISSDGTCCVATRPSGRTAP